MALRITLSIIFLNTKYAKSFLIICANILSVLEIDLVPWHFIWNHSNNYQHTFEEEPHKPLHRFVGFPGLATFKLLSVELLKTPSLLTFKLEKLLGLPQLK